MGVREKLEDRIKRKEQEIQDYQIKIAEANAYLQGLQEALKLLPKDYMNGNGSEEIVLRKGSAVQKTQEFLKEQGKPMHIMDILRGIGKEPNSNERTSLSGSLGLYVRKNQIFARPEPNTFGLIEWEDDPDFEELEQSEDFSPGGEEVPQDSSLYDDCPF
ncbi:MAG TPA: hypothetical protein VGK02_06790 [Candidatus Aquicultor sp.]|jgi:hypothetical protein